MSRIARKGFKIEKRIVNHINNGTNVGVKLIECISQVLNISCRNYHAVRLHGRKADIKIICDDNEILVSVKSYKPEADYNHVERNFVEEYKRRWNMPEDVYTALKMFVGEVNQEGKPVLHEDMEKEAERMSFDAFNNEAQQRIARGFLSQDEYNKILEEVKKKGISPGLLGKMRRVTFNKLRNCNPRLLQSVIEYFRGIKHAIVYDVLMGNEPIKIFIVVRREIHKDLEKLCYYIAKADTVIEVYSQGDVKITERGNLLIGDIELQRKGGNQWRGGKWKDTVANQLQFKIRPSKILEVAKFVTCEELAKEDTGRVITLNEFFKGS